MIIRHFKIHNYKCFSDTDYIDINGLTTIVGKNGSGKSALLEALDKFNSIRENEYNYKSDWPKNIKLEAIDYEKLAISIKFIFEKHEIEEIKKRFKIKTDFSEILISKNYLNQFIIPNIFELSDHNYSKLANEVIEIIKSRLNTVGDYDDKSMQKLRDVFIGLSGRPTYDAYISKEQDINNIISIINDHEEEPIDIISAVKSYTALVESKSEYDKFYDLIVDYLPEFLYLDSYPIFMSDIFLDELYSHEQAGNLREFEQYALMIFDLAGINYKEELKRSDDKDKSDRMIAIDEASKKINDLIESVWNQDKYKIKLKLDQKHFAIFIESDYGGVQRMEKIHEKSKGFQWFLSFDLFMAEKVKSGRRDEILLLDEPGIHLHPTGQKDLLNRMKQYARDKIMIFTTHLPAMISVKDYDNIRVCYDNNNINVIGNDLLKGTRESVFPILEKIGIDISETLFFNKKNVVTEGSDDFAIISYFNDNIIDNIYRLGDNVSIVFCGGASKMSVLVSQMLSNNYDVVALFDSDDQGRDAKRKILEGIVMKDSRIITIADIVSGIDNPTIEDMIEIDEYIEAYKRYSQITIDVKTIDKSMGIVRQIEKRHGKYSHRGVIMEYLRRINAEGNAVNIGTSNNFAKLIKEIRKRLKL